MNISCCSLIYRWFVKGVNFLGVLAAIYLIGPGLEALATPTPVFSPSSQMSVNQFMVQVSCGDPQAEIRYTTNGMDPTQTDAIITSGSMVFIGGNLTLKARAWDANGNTSSIASAYYSLTGKVACGSKHVIALQSNGRLSAWGLQTNGRLGNGSIASTSVLVPVRVLQSASTLFNNGADIAAGNDQCVVVDSSSNPWTFGNNSNGQLGNNTTTASAYPVRVLKSTVAGDYLTGIEQVSAGTSFSLATGSNGWLWAWGTTASGCLGNGVSSGNQPFAVNVTTTDAGNPKLTGIVLAEAGATFGLALDGTGQVWSWGLNSNGQLGIGNITIQTRASRVKLNATTNFTGCRAVAAGIAHGIALANDGTVWCWGLQTNGRLGNGQSGSGNITYPVKVQSSATQYLGGVVAVTSGPDFNLALDAAGQVWAWGNNASGNLGDGTTTASVYAKPVALSMPVGVGVAGIAAGGAGGLGYSFVILSDGSVRSWGCNAQGELAINSTTTQKSPAAAAPGLYWNNQPPILSLNTGGSYTAPANATLNATATDNDGTVSRVDFYCGSRFLGSDTMAPYTVQLAGLTAGNYGVSAIAYDDCGASCAAVSGTVSVSDPVSPATPTRYSRGLGSDTNYLSYVIGLDFEKGVQLDPMGNNFSKFPGADNDVTKLPWFMRIQKHTAYQITNISGTVGYTLPFENPLVAFGAEGGGSALYTGQSYTFGVGSGGQLPSMTWLGDFRVEVYDKKIFRMTTQR